MNRRLHTLKLVLAIATLFLHFEVQGNRPPVDSILHLVELDLKNFHFQQAQLKLNEVTERLPTMLSAQRCLFFKSKGHLLAGLRSKSQSIYYYTKAENIALRIKDSQLIKQLSYEKWITFRELGAQEDRKKYKKKFSDMINRKEDTLFLINYYRNEAIDLYSEHNEHKENGHLRLAKESIEKALEFSRKSMSLGKLNMTAFHRSILKTCYNMCIYLGEASKFDEEKEQIKEFMHIGRQFPEALAMKSGYQYYADILNREGQKDSALVYYRMGLDEARKAKDLDIQLICYRELSNILKSVDRHDQAYYYMQKVMDTQNEIATIKDESSQDIFRMLLNEADNQEQIKSLLESTADYKYKSNLFIFLLVGIMIAGLIYFLFTRYRNRLKFQLARQSLRTERAEREKVDSDRLVSELTAELRGQERERDFIAQELHDTVANGIGGLKNKLEAVSWQEGGLQKKQLVDKSIIQLDGLYHQVRNLSHLVHIPNFHENDFCFLLEELFADFERMSSIQVEHALFPEEALNNISGQASRNLYLIVQELLMNAQKHSSTESINVNLNLHDDELILIFEDHGSGFKNQKRGIGLQNIEKRVQSMNGSWEITSIAEAGTCVHILIPKSKSNEQ